MSGETEKKRGVGIKTFFPEQKLPEINNAYLYINIDYLLIMPTIPSKLLIIPITTMICSPI